MRKRTHEEFIKLMEEAHPNIEVLGTYKTAKTKIKVRCKICGHKWEAFPSSLLQGYGCLKCKIIKRTKTHEQFMQELHEVNPHANNIQVLGTYVKGKTKLKVRCKVCGHEWETIPNNLLQGHGCPKCGKKQSIQKQTKTHDQFIKELQEINPDIEVLGTYVNNSTKILCKCKVCGHIWEVVPNSLLRGSGCPKCGIKIITQKNTETYEEFMEKFNTKNTHAKDIEILGTYVNSQTKILCRCRKDEYEWETRPASLLQGYGCPKCSISKGEKRVAQYLQDNNISYISQYKFNDCRFKLPLPFDFYLPQYNTCIEYDGDFHYKIIKNLGGVDGLIDTKIRDTVKNIYCENNNITLIRIPYWDYDNIEKILDAVIKQEEAI